MEDPGNIYEWKAAEHLDEAKRLALVVATMRDTDVITMTVDQLIALAQLHVFIGLAADAID